MLYTTLLKGNQMNPINISFQLNTFGEKREFIQNNPSIMAKHTNRPRVNNSGWCNYDYSLKGKQIYNGESVYYSDTNWTPGIEEFVKSVDAGFKLIAVQAMTTHKDQYYVHGLKWGAEVKNPKHDATENGRCGVGRIIVEFNGVRHTSPALSLGVSWASTAGASRLAARYFANSVFWNVVFRGPLRTFLGGLVAEKNGKRKTE